MTLAALLREGFCHRVNSARISQIESRRPLFSFPRLQMFDEGKLPVVPSGRSGVKTGRPVRGDECGFGIYAIYFGVRGWGKKRERERARVYRNWAVSILLCRRTSVRRRKKTLKKQCYFSWQLAVIYFIPFHSECRCVCRRGSDGVNKKGPGVPPHRLCSKQALRITTGFFRSIRGRRCVCPVLCFTPSNPSLEKKISHSSSHSPNSHACQSALLKESNCLSVNVCFSKSLLSGPRYKIVVKCDGLAGAGWRKSPYNELVHSWAPDLHPKAQHTHRM